MNSDKLEFKTTKEELGASSLVDNDEFEEEHERTSIPSCSKDFLEYMEDLFDIRKIINYSDSLDELKGIQCVLNKMRQLYDNHFLNE